MGDLARTAIYGVVKLALDKLAALATPKGRVGAPLAAGGRWPLRLLNLGSGYASSAHLTLVLAGAGGRALWSLLGGAAWFCALHLLGRRVTRGTGRPLLVGVCGVSCSGKSTVATELARALNNDPHASALCQDDSFDYDSFATNACPQRAVTDGSEHRP